MKRFFSICIYKQYYFIALLNDLPGVKPGAFLAESVIFAPVLGLRPGRSLLVLTLNVPKPVKTTFSPLFNESRIVLRNVCTESRAALLVRFDFFATISIMSFLVIYIHLPSRNFCYSHNDNLLI
jgi:hypothetical protein